MSFSSRHSTFISLLAVAASIFVVPAHGQDWAKAALEKSPRHGEWIEVKQGDRTLRCYVVFPEVASKVSAVLVIHEIFGLTDWARHLTDQVAAAGYIAIAPDLISGRREGQPAATPPQEEARRAVSQLPKEQVMKDLNAVAEHAVRLPACNGKIAVAGFCWGGSRAFEFAGHRKDLQAAYVFYGSGPDNPEEIAAINCPVFGFYAENDARVNATIEKSAALMKEAGKIFELQKYLGAGHGFMRAGEAPDASEPNRKAQQDAWTRWKSLLGQL